MSFLQQILSPAGEDIFLCDAGIRSYLPELFEQLYIAAHLSL